jgi:hypothetical protein
VANEAQRSASHHPDQAVLHLGQGDVRVMMVMGALSLLFICIPLLPVINRPRPSGDGWTIPARPGIHRARRAESSAVAMIETQPSRRESASHKHRTASPCGGVRPEHPRCCRGARA